MFKTDHIVDRIYNERAQRIKSEEENENTEPQPKKVKINEDSDMSETKEERIPKRKIDWQNKTYLAPLTTVGNMPFRRICKKYGCDITCGEMAMTQQILQGNYELLVFFTNTYCCIFLTIQYIHETFVQLFTFIVSCPL